MTGGHSTRDRARCYAPAMSQRLQGAAALVTGCASGIGRATALELARRGARVVACDIDQAGLEALAREPGFGDAKTEVLDVRDSDAWDRVVDATVEAHGKLDLLVHCAGVLAPVWGHRTPPSDVHRVIDVNVKGVIFGTNSAARVMVPRGRGHIVSIASLAGIVPVPGISVYSASKHAARAYAIAVGQELRKLGVYVTVVCPTVVATPMMDIQLEAEAAALTFSGKRPLTVDEVVLAVLDRALVKKPLELVLDVPWTGQGFFSKVANTFPDLGARFRGQFVKAGRAHQRRLRDREARTDTSGEPR